MIITICDRCKKDINNIYMYGFGRAGESFSQTDRFDLCPKCADKIRELINKEIHKC